MRAAPFLTADCIEPMTPQCRTPAADTYVCIGFNHQIVVQWWDPDVGRVGSIRLRRPQINLAFHGRSPRSLLRVNMSTAKGATVVATVTNAPFYNVSLFWPIVAKYYVYRVAHKYCNNIGCLVSRPLSIPLNTTTHYAVQYRR